MIRAQLRESVLSLPKADRAALAHDLITSLDEDASGDDVDALWTAEVNRRAEEVADGKVALVPAEDVHADISERLGSRTGK